ncbi:hypothetical protein BBW65_00845 [Helicobacter enhydrae]|uniref:Multidrug-efflux transporter n=1 Tax=Helicobacter enhydrae TaxID=222136 RepID=A0A1B1U3X1_9HELI|nr:MATE family efflux transporter [Helicobacter enhydrae]ANV97449.1 hypothetical protein BBW65_00845 [Helicobacter enhydrae]
MKTLCAPSSDTLAKSKEILKIAIPSGLSSFLDILNLSIVLLFVSMLSDSNIVAFGLGMNFLMLFYTFTNIFFTGSNTLIARLHKTQPRQIGPLLFNLTLGNLLSSIPLFCLALVSFSSYLHWFGLNSGTLVLAHQFLEVLIFSIPAIMTKTTLTVSFAATSKAHIPFYIKLFFTFFNLVLTYFLALGVGDLPQLGLVGAGIAGVITSYLETFVLGFYAHKTFGIKQNWEFSQFFESVWIGLPTGIERGLTILSLILTARFLASYNEEVLAGFQIGGRIEAFIFMPAFGFMVASMSLTAQNLVLKQYALIDSYIRLSLFLSSSIMGVLGVLMAIFGTTLAQIFTNRNDIIQYASDYLIAVGLSQIPLVCIFVLDGLNRGAKKAKISLLIHTTSIWTLRIVPMYFCTLYYLPYYYLFVIIFAETYLRAIAFWVAFKKSLWQV